MKDVKKIGVLSVLLCLSLSVHADEVGRGGAAGAFLRVGVGARYQGMGGGGAALTGDADAVTYNPAGSVFLDGRHATISLSSMALDRKLHHIGYAQSLGGRAVTSETGTARPPFSAGFALGWLSAGVDRIDGRDFDGAHTGMLSMDEHAFHFSFAIRPAPILGIGFSTRVLYSRMPGLLDDGGAMASTGVGFDAGLMIRPFPSVSIGAVLQDLRSKNTWDSQKMYEQAPKRVDPFPRTWTLGLAWNPVTGLILNLNVRQTESRPAVFRGGCEWECLPGVFLRGGMHEENLSAGAGYGREWHGRRLQIDYAYVSDPVAPRGNHVFSWSFRF
ncbi:MAG TPA: hypothetical protein ENN17_10495 [bacterium]|nr:hypothetical protein [bacterium]